MPFNARQTLMIALFAIFWTAFMLWWNGDYGTARVAIMLAIGVMVALVWGFWMKKYGAWKDQA
jgi:putative flippase GtrA